MIQTNLVCSYDDKGRVYQHCKFMTPGAWVLMLGRGHISHYSEYVVYSTLSIYIILVAIVLRDYNAAFLYHRWFSFTVFYDGAVDIQIWAPLTRSQFKVSNTQVTVNARGPFVGKGLGPLNSLYPWMRYAYFVKISVVVHLKSLQTGGRTPGQTDRWRPIGDQKSSLEHSGQVR